jgi:hypothetical protein
LLPPTFSSHAKKIIELLSYVVGLEYGSMLHVAKGMVAYLSTGDPICNSAAIVAEIDLGDIRKISKDGVGFGHGYHSSVAIGVGIYRSHLAGIVRLQDVLSYCALYPVSTSENTGFGDFPVCKSEDDLGRLLFDINHPLVELDILYWNEAGHDVKERFSMCLQDISITESTQFPLGRATNRFTDEIRVTPGRLAVP